MTEVIVDQRLLDVLTQPAIAGQSAHGALRLFDHLDDGGQGAIHKSVSEPSYTTHAQGASPALRLLHVRH